MGAGGVQWAGGGGAGAGDWLGVRGVVRGPGRRSRVGGCIRAGAGRTRRGAPRLGLHHTGLWSPHVRGVVILAEPPRDCAGDVLSFLPMGSVAGVACAGALHIDHPYAVSARGRGEVVLHRQREGLQRGRRQPLAVRDRGRRRALGCVGAAMTGSWGTATTRRSSCRSSSPPWRDGASCRSRPARTTRCS